MPTDQVPRLREFFESFPLLRRFEVTAGTTLPFAEQEKRLLPTSLTLPCSVCRHVESTTWKLRHNELFEHNDNEFHVRYAYTCADCAESRTLFWVLWQRTGKRTDVTTGGGTHDVYSVRKLGQFAPWTMKIPRRLEKALGDRIELFKRGLSNYGQGYGIGAAAYFRRVIEEEVDELLDLVQEAAQLEGDQAVLDNIKAARKSQVASDRLSIAAQQVPAALRPGNTNPLATLYGYLSGPLHSESDDEALETAETILQAFIFLFENLKERLEKSREYAEQMTKLAGKRKG